MLKHLQLIHNKFSLISRFNKKKRIFRSFLLIFWKIKVEEMLKNNKSRNKMLEKRNKSENLMKNQRKLWVF